ncbi:MAG: hypothetical protein HZB67_01460 [Candidatus Aenigmarchaeota archaeon]|nr:hypothetical protein [Candidatus Aenigmarchaeota archaeon]
MAKTNYAEKQPMTGKLRKVQIFYMVVVGLFAAALITLGTKYSATAQIASFATEGLSSCSSDLDKCTADKSTVTEQFTTCTANYVESQDNLASCNSKYASMNTNYTSCKTQLTSSQGQLSSCSSDKSTCQSTLSGCNNDKNNCQGSLSSCSSDKSSLQTSFDTIAQNYAASKCCGTTNYPYYYIENSNIVCTNDAGSNTKTTGC